MIIINIAKDYTKTPGGRYVSQGDYSGEDFRIKILEPKFFEAKENKEKLIINLDGVYGYPASFLDEAFGGLARKFPNEDFTILEIVTNVNPQWKTTILENIKDAQEMS